VLMQHQGQHLALASTSPPTRLGTLKKRKKRLHRKDLQLLHDELDETVASIGRLGQAGDEGDGSSITSNSIATNDSQSQAVHVNPYVFGNMQAVSRNTGTVKNGAAHSVGRSVRSTQSKRSTRSTRSSRSRWSRSNLEDIVSATILGTSPSEINKSGQAVDSAACSVDYILQDLGQQTTDQSTALPLLHNSYSRMPTDDFVLSPRFQPLTTIPSAATASEDTVFHEIDCVEQSLMPWEGPLPNYSLSRDDGPWHDKIHDFEEAAPFCTDFPSDNKDPMLPSTCSKEAMNDAETSYDQSTRATSVKTSMDTERHSSNELLLDDLASSASSSVSGSHCRTEDDAEVRQTASNSDVLTSSPHENLQGVSSPAADDHWITFEDDNTNPFVYTCVSQKSPNTVTQYPYARSSWKSSETGWKETSTKGRPYYF
jgi:hypothetical protein